VAECGGVELEEDMLALLKGWKRESYGHNVVFFHEARLVACEQAEHGQHEGHNGASQREQS
jgi:hypothetical protein